MYICILATHESLRCGGVGDLILLFKSGFVGLKIALFS
jgi:hypothetical protein